MSILELHPSTLVSVQVETDYITQKHDCCSLEEFDPELCPPCLVCGHCSARHQDLPIGRGVCDEPTCSCFHLATDGDCELSSGAGTVADNDDNEYECIRCAGHGVTG